MPLAFTETCWKRVTFMPAPYIRRRTAFRWPSPRSPLGPRLTTRDARWSKAPSGCVHDSYHVAVTILDGGNEFALSDVLGLLDALRSCFDEQVVRRFDVGDLGVRDGARHALAVAAGIEPDLAPV